MGNRLALVTLTYRSGGQFQYGHVREFLYALREWCAAQDVEFRACWKLEQTRLGTPYVSVAVLVPRDRSLPHADRAGWWSHGITSTSRLRVSSPGQVAAYAAGWSAGLSAMADTPPSAPLTLARASGPDTSTARCDE